MKKMKEKERQGKKLKHAAKVKTEQSVRLPAEGNNLAFYLKEINNIPLMTREEEEKIARDAAAGDKTARNKLVNSNLRFVVNVAKKYQGLGMSLEDLIAEGNIGLINAADRFDPEKNCHFISYAVWWIRQSIISAIDVKSRMIRLPGNRIAELGKIVKARRFIRNQCLSDNDVSEISKMVNVEEDVVSNLLNVSRDMISLDTPVYQYSDTSLKDLVEGQYKNPETITEQSIMKESIEEALNTLKEQEADVIRCHFGLDQSPPMTLSEIGDKYNLSKERIRQIKEKAISRLKNPLRQKKLQWYVA